MNGDPIRVRTHRLWLALLYLMAARGFLYMAVDDRLHVAASGLAAVGVAIATSLGAVHIVAWVLAKVIQYLEPSRRTT